MKAKMVDEIYEPKKDNNIIRDELGFPAEETKNTDLMVVKEVLKTMMDKKNIGMKTDLTPKEIMLVARCRMMAKYYQIKILDRFLDMLLQLKLSNKRKSREEMVNIISQISAREEPDLSMGGRSIGETW
ncbi:MAG: hypothetical protein PHS68_05770 [Candidatus Izemoplasmatales bacterium]|nr:hypothetical protein [Candidatus Izemoplasmatales bacterium]